MTTRPVADNAAKQHVGTLDLFAVYIGDRTFRWWIQNVETGEIAVGDDLHSPEAAPTPDNDDMLYVLAAFLSADAEAYSGSGKMGTEPPAEPYLFGAEVAGWAYLNSDELDEFALEQDINPKEH